VAAKLREAKSKLWRAETVEDTQNLLIVADLDEIALQFAACAAAPSRPGALSANDTSPVVDSATLSLVEMPQETVRRIARRIETTMQRSQ
jgi:hypothetical protein